jgi:hypothetical protein
MLTYQEAEDSNDPEIMRQYWLEQQQQLQQQDRYWEPLDRAWAYWFQHEKTEQDLLDDPSLQFKPSARKMHELTTKLVYNDLMKRNEKS